MEARTLLDSKSATPICRPLLAAALAVLAGCAPRPLLDRAIRARGGPLAGLVMEAEAEVYVGAPGTWRYTRAFLSPGLYGWRIVTADEPISHLFDGTAVHCFIGETLVSCDPSPHAPLRTHARWTAVVNLDALRAPGVAVTPLAAGELPDGIREGLAATFPDGARYRLGFDDRTLLVWAEGPLDLSPVVVGAVTARFADHRPAAHLLLPFAASYRFGADTIVDEKVLAACVDPPDLTAASFGDPRKLPGCP